MYHVFIECLPSTPFDFILWPSIIWMVIFAKIVTDFNYPITKVSTWSVHSFHDRNTFFLLSHENNDCFIIPLQETFTRVSYHETCLTGHHAYLMLVNNMLHCLAKLLHCNLPVTRTNTLITLPWTIKISFLKTYISKSYFGLRAVV